MRIPFFKDVAEIIRHTVTQNVERLLHITRQDWNAFERSWEFQTLPFLPESYDTAPTLASSFASWVEQNTQCIAEIQRLEEENNRLFIDAYGLADELSSDLPLHEVTLTVNPAYRYKNTGTETDQQTRFQRDTMAEMISFVIGCMMGRYSLDEPGLVYAGTEGKGFDPARYASFAPDEDGIVPITNQEWFPDDAVVRLTKFMKTVWRPEDLETNLAFLSSSLGPKRGETARAHLRRYFCKEFYKDHVKIYQKRPIYWLFSSGRLGAFQCLVYLHRFRDGTLARMRTEYVMPLQSMMAHRIELLDGDIGATSSTTQRKRLENEQKRLRKELAEVSDFDDRLRHYADARIRLDLDNGVKVNYGKFGDLLAKL